MLSGRGIGTTLIQCECVLRLKTVQVSVGFLNPAVVLLQISAKHIIVTLVGEIIDLELHSPCGYLLALQKGLKATDKSSRHVSSGAFLSMLRFDNREKLESLQIDLGKQA